MPSGIGLGQRLAAGAQNVAISTDDTVAVNVNSATCLNGNVLPQSGQFPSIVGARAVTDSLSTVLALCSVQAVTVTAFNAVSLVASATVGLLLILVNTNASNAQWVLVCDKASAPVNGDAPVHRIRVNAVSSVIVDLRSFNFVNGVALAESSTTGTVTLTGGSDMQASYGGR